MTCRNPALTLIALVHDGLNSERCIFLDTEGDICKRLRPPGYWLSEQRSGSIICRSCRGATLVQDFRTADVAGFPLPRKGHPPSHLNAAVRLNRMQVLCRAGNRIAVWLCKHQLHMVQTMIYATMPHAAPCAQCNLDDVFS